ncbi:heterokaryon incompatibility protein-domain-containing protein [Xylaria cubensis]|nr:heterokaryon incompatibility protein-domain-containing protein [Xylaria cubensis]
MLTTTHIPRDDMDGKRQIYKLAKIVGPITISLSNRDSRFLFIRESFDDFLYGEYGLHSTESEPAPESVILDPSEGHICLVMLLDIVNAVIYEILNIFDIDLTLAQVLKVKSSLLPNVDLLKQLYQISLDLAPQQRKTILLETLTPSQDIHGYQYPRRLEASNIRVLSIQPGLEESSIECQLEERNLEIDVIEEALSYVWGEPILDKAIKVDGKSFLVTANLNNILRSLRCQDVPRKVWIDAICINQSDLDEKGHQVRLMRRIYSKAQRTTIWLGDQSTKRKAPESDFLGSPTDYPIDNLIPMLNKFGGNHVDRYDLPALYDAVLQYQVDSAWDEKRFILSIMFLRCMNIIRRNEWWKRVWTVQEAVLPPNEPIIWFCGHTFSFSTVVSAIDAADAFAKIKRLQYSVTPVTRDLYSRFHEERIATVETKGDELFLHQIRHRTPLLRALLPWMLSSVHAHRATDPRDKIFALESLLTKSEGRLINVNYHETIESLFRRITAQCLNQVNIHPHILYYFFVEHLDSLDNTPSGPSWVYDFTHSRAGRRDSALKSVLHPFLHRKEYDHPFFYDHFQEAICFASPKVLFCSGVLVGIIDGIFQVQEQIEHSAEGIQALENVIEWWEIAERRCGNQTMEHNTESADGDSDVSGKVEREGSSLGPTREEVKKLVTFGSPIFETSHSTRTSNKSMLEQAKHQLSGTYFFITEEGILGRATAPVQKGDLLAIVHRHPNYMILRGANDQDTPSQKKENQRIVARGMVAESQDKMRARINKDIQSCFFQIV